MITLRQPKIRFQAAPDGRIGCREVFEYELMNGDRTPFRPLGGETWHVIVHDLAIYNELHASGWLYSPAHTGRVPEVIDNRRTS